MTVLFDVDGTLVDTWELYIEAYLRTFEPHLGRRITFQELRALRPRSERDVLSRTVPEIPLDRVHRQFLDHYGALHPERFGGVYPGARELLEALRGRGIPVGIVTGKSRGAWRITGDAAELGSFEAVVCDDDVVEPKPSAEGLRTALEHLGAEAGDAIYVGDSVSDAKAARTAGVAFAAALWAKGREELEAFRAAVREEGAWAELHRPPELLDRMERDAGTGMGDGG